MMLGVDGTHARRLVSSPRPTPYNPIPRSTGSSHFFADYWANNDGLDGLRDFVDADLDESMASSSPTPSSSFDGPISPMTTGSFGGRGDASSSSSSSYPRRRLGRIDSLGLSGIGSMHLQDVSLSPQPPPSSSSFLETVGEEDHVGSDGDGSETTYGMFGSIDLHSPLSVAFQGEDTDMPDMAMAMDLDVNPWIPALPIPVNTDPAATATAMDLFSPAITRLGRSNTAPSVSYQPTPMEDTPRRSSLKRGRSQRNASRETNIFCDCPRPDRPKHHQNVSLRQLPTEILVEIFHYALMWPPAKPILCEHQLRRPIERRATTGTTYPRPRVTVRETSSTVSSVLEPSESPDSAPKEKSEEARRFGINTLVRLAYTCKLFYGLIWSDDPVSDRMYWGVAARSCWPKLPEKLCDVQGKFKESQTSWKNLVAVFARSENSQFRTRGGGGKGGVDCFGGNKACKPASTWSNEKARRKQIERDGRIPRRLVLACAQPGPDGFTITLDEDSKTWTIALQLQDGVEYLVHLDEYGRFGEAGRLPEGLKRSKNPGYFSPNIYKDAKNRFRIVKVQVRKGLRTPSQFTGHARGNVVQEAVTWDLASIPEYVVDAKARVARCISHGPLLLCSLFTHRNPSPLDAFLHPPEDARLFCIEATAQDPGTDHEDDEMGGMSARRRGKLPQKDVTHLRWRREFEYWDQTVSVRDLHPVICNIQMNSKNVVALIRWNATTTSSMQQLYDREFHVLDPLTGNTTKRLEFPNLFWDYRHHDMHKEYNLLRVNKLEALYNPRPNQSMGSGNRSTRIHGDAFFLTDTHVISGSHDYCNWIWPLARQTPPKGEYNAEHNDGGIVDEPFDVLDDYYWNNNKTTTTTRPSLWNPLNERAGWWVKTPNQVLCFWHGVAMSHDQAAFAVCRPGKLFVWNLDAEGNEDNIKGYSCLGSAAGERERWLGKPKREIEKKALEGWYLHEDVMPEQGLWLLYEDGDAVFVDRDEILEACGVGDMMWGFGREEFGWEEEAVVVPEEALEESESEDEEVNVGKRLRFSYDASAATAAGGDEEMEVPFWE